MDWLSNIPNDLDDSLGAAELSEQHISVIKAQIIEPYNVTVKSFFSHFENSFPTQVYARKDLILEVLVAQRALGDSDVELVADYLTKSLELPDEHLDWSTSNKKLCIKYYYALRVLRKTIGCLDLPPTTRARLLISASFHAFPDSPWSSQANSQLVVEPIKSNLPQFDEVVPNMIRTLKPKFLSVSKSENNPRSLNNSKLSSAGYASTKGRASGLKPQLGYSHIYESMDEESSRRDWKATTNVGTISSIWLLIDLADGAWFDNYWAVVTSFILNLIDDSDVVFKGIAVRLLHKLAASPRTDDSKGNLFVRTGLVDVFLDSLKVCLSYLPESTPVEQSQVILDAAYPAVFKLAEIKSTNKGNKLEFFEIINGHLLSSIDSCFDRFGTTAKHPILLLLLSKLRYVIELYVQEEILLSWTRCNFVLNQIIVNPHLIDSVSGIQCISECLKVQRTTLQSFSNADEEGKALLMEFKFDFLAAWCVYLKRMIKTQLGFQNPIKECIGLLGTLGNITDDVQAIIAENEELEKYLV